MKSELYFSIINRPQIDIIKYDNNLNIFSKKMQSSIYEKDIYVDINRETKNQDINNYLLKSIDYRLNTTKNTDLIIIFNIYKNLIERTSFNNDLILNVIENKLVNINKRIKNNYAKLFKLFDEYRYYKDQISSDMKVKGKTPKLIKVRDKIHNYFTSKIDTVEKRIDFLSSKMSILKYHEQQIKKGNISDEYINQFIKDFIDKNKNHHDIRVNLNEILLYNYGNNGAYYDGIKLSKTIDKCKNTKTICDVKALMYA